MFVSLSKSWPSLYEWDLTVVTDGLYMIRIGLALGTQNSNNTLGQNYIESFYNCVYF